LRCRDKLAYGLALGFIALAAHAETVDLFCQVAGATGGNGLNVSIDLASGTAVAWPTWSSRQNVAVSQATITADQVTWGQIINNAPQYTLDRRSGVLNQLSQNQMGGPFAVVTSFSCKRQTPVL